MIILGLTGSIAMGKSTIAAMFEEMDVPVFDADAHVHDLLASNQEVLRQIKKQFTPAQYPKIYQGQTIDRSELGRVIFANQAAREKIEHIIHPQIQKRKQAFLSKHEETGHGIVLLDIPLLFGTQSDKEATHIIVVSAPEDIQKKRALERAGMTDEKFKAILASQMPDHEKRARADFVVHTHLGYDASMKKVHEIVESLRKKESKNA